jgi:hypothetical protein
MSKTTDVVKIVAKSIVGVSTAFTVSNVLKNNVIADGPVQKTEIWIGSTVIGLVAAEQAEKYINRIINVIVDTAEKQNN